MDAEKKQHAGKGLKGSVLFTILVVMTIMLILMIATIGLASNASRRAYSEYFDHQTTSTARSMVDSVVSALKTDQQALGVSIVSQLQGPGHPDVTLTVNNGNDLGEGFGTVNSIVFSYVGEDSASGFNIQGTGKSIIKVTATVTQGGVTSTYSQYVIGEAASDNQTSSGGGLIALGGFEGVAEPGVDANSPAYFGVKNAFTYDKKVTLSNPNNGKLNSTVVNSSAELKTSIPVLLDPKEGLSIMGSLFVNDGTLKVSSTQTRQEYFDAAEAAGNFKTIDKSYLYVGGTLYLTNNLETKVDANDAPINVFCGRIVTEGNGNINGNANIFCYNDTTGGTPNYDQTNLTTFSTDSWSKIGTANESKLISWADGTFNKYHGQSIDTGVLYTLGNLELTGKVNIGGDVYVKGDLNAHDLTNGGANINGNLYVEGSITNTTKDGDGQVSLKNCVKGTIYNGAAKVDGFSEAYPATVPAMITDFKSGELTLDSIKNSVVKTTDALKKQFYKKKTVGGTEVEYFTDAKNESALIINNDTLVYTYESNNIKVRKLDGTDVTSTYVTTGTVGGDFNYKVKITESCIMKGRFEGSNIYIEPSSEIWINLHNLDLANTCNIVINDNAGKVNFFLPTDSTNLSEVHVATGCEAKYKALFGTTTNGTTTYNNSFVTNSEAKIMTLAYYTHMKNDARIDLIPYPTNDVDASNNPVTTNDWMLPKVGFYAAENAKVLINFTNNVLLTGDICCPGAEFYSKSGSTSFGSAQLYYNGRKIASGKLGCIGSIIVDKIKEFNNDFGMAYVDYPSSYRPVISTGLTYAWSPIDGYADY